MLGVRCSGFRVDDMWMVKSGGRASPKGFEREVGSNSPLNQIGFGLNHSFKPKGGWFKPPFKAKGVWFKPPFAPKGVWFKPLYFSFFSFFVVKMKGEGRGGSKGEWG